MARNLRPLVVLAILLAFPMTLRPAVAYAQGHGHRRGPTVVVGGYYGSQLYDPFFSPYWWGPTGYPYGYRYGLYSDAAEVRVQATPKDAEVFVDGFYAGIVDNFDGVFQRLNVRPGGHEFVLYREGYRAVHQMIYVQPGSSVTIRQAMVPLAPGETIEPRPAPVPSAPGARTGQRPGQPSPGPAGLLGY